MSAWKLSAEAPREVVHAALLAHEDADDFPGDVIVAGREMAEDRPGDWIFEAWLDREPTQADERAVIALFAPHARQLVAEKLPDTDWLTHSQSALQPIRAGRFHVHAPGLPPLDTAGVRDFAIPASQAFGTGQHATTAGCLAMLSAMKARGVVARNVADIGTGTGLLAFAALHLWPRALATASDIDDVCLGVVADNAAANTIALGAGPGALTMLVADGMAHPLLAARAPYDLLIANILAGPLVDLAPAFARATVPGSSLLLAGLLTTQERAVRVTYVRTGFRLAARLVKGDWTILWLRRRGAR